MQLQTSCLPLLLLLLTTHPQVRVYAQHPEGVVTVRFKAEEPAQVWQ
jgi:hypothetical protein